MQIGFGQQRQLINASKIFHGTRPHLHSIADTVCGIYSNNGDSISLRNRLWVASAISYFTDSQLLSGASRRRGIRLQMQQECMCLVSASLWNTTARPTTDIPLVFRFFKQFSSTMYIQMPESVQLSSTPACALFVKRLPAYLQTTWRMRDKQKTLNTYTHPHTQLQTKDSADSSATWLKNTFFFYFPTHVWVAFFLRNPVRICHKKQFQMRRARGYAKKRWNGRGSAVTFKLLAATITRSRQALWHLCVWAIWFEIE